ncbi:MAG: autotransporter outer membrane beta-barrel domain-containing protein, partial [Betaproteobacteria bacterium]
GTIASNCDALGVSDSVVALRNSPARGAAAVIDANPDLLALFSGLPSDQARSNAVTQTLPLLVGGSAMATSAGLASINRIIQARLEGNRGLSAGDSFDGDRYMWVKPFNSWADQDERDSVSGFRANTAGLALGADAAFAEHWRLGGALAYARGDITGKSDVAPQSASVDMFVVIGYGSYSLDDRTDINFQVDVGQNKTHSARGITLTSSAATAAYDSFSGHLGLGVGRTYTLGDHTNLTPSVRADYTMIKDGGYSESGAGALSLNVDSRKAEQLILGTDARLTHHFTDQWSGSVNLGVGYDTINSQASIVAAFAGAPGAAFVTYGIDPSPWLGRAGAGVTYKVKSAVELTARYDAEARETFTNQTASIKVRWVF